MSMAAHVGQEQCSCPRCRFPAPLRGSHHYTGRRPDVCMKHPQPVLLFGQGQAAMMGRGEPAPPAARSPTAPAPPSAKARFRPALCPLW